MNLNELREIVSLFEQADITELELEREGVKIKLKKGAAPEVSAAPTREVPSRVEKAPPTGEKAAAPLTEIVAPMVGTFYQAPSPEAEPFVEVGQEIEEGQVVCILEAMKLMNEIKSEIKGRINAILVENGQAVEFGQPLFLVEKT